MMAIIALISDFIDLAIKAIGSVFPDAAQAIQQALSQLFDFINYRLTQGSFALNVDSYKAAGSYSASLASSAFNIKLYL